MSPKNYIVKELNHILKDVSRSFYLSMRILPARMREVVSLAYLMARISDTLADEGTLDSQVRLSILHSLKVGEITQLGEALKEFTSRFTNPKEQALLKQLEVIWNLKEELPAIERNLVNEVLDHIIEGQIEDVKRFEIDQTQIKEKVELFDYCYKVAGCVGEFWTKVGFNVDPKFSTINSEELCHLGANLGRGLQLVNILRDSPKDIVKGRVYLPGVLEHDESALKSWIIEARLLLQSGETYYKSLRSKRQKLAVYMPTRLALQTLEKLERASQDQWSQGVKVPRKTVYLTFFRGLLC